jgi:CDP-diacylglycerol--glycerol-3-phosphate 3-phosphatidyltransferase
MRDDLGLVLAGALVGFFLFTLAVFAIRSVWAGLPVTDDVRRRAGNRLFGIFVMEFWYWVIGPVERGLIRLRVPANALTALSLLLSTGAAAAFAWGRFGLGGWLLLFGATFDIFDGRVARALGTAGPAGAFLDSCLDRYGEMLALFGLLAYYRSDPLGLWLSLGALAGSAMVSYTRARGEGLGVDYQGGLMQRAERAVYVGLAAALAPFLALWLEPGRGHPRYHLVLVALGAVAVLANVTAVQRMVRIARELRGR